MPVWEQEAEGGLAKPSVLDTKLSSGPKRRSLPLAAQTRPDQDCNGVYPDLGTSLETHKLIHLRSQHDTSQGSPTQMPLGFSK